MRKRPLLGMFLLVVFLVLAAWERGALFREPPDFSDGETVTVTGTVEEIAEKENSRQIRLSHIYLSSDASYQRQVLVYENQQTKLKIGYRIKVTGVYTPLEAASNPGQFDQKAYYEARGIGFVLKKGKITVLEAKERVFFQKLYELRRFWAAVLENIAGKEEAGLLQAMLLGEKSGLKQEQKELYQAGGISHILAISGLHISLLGMLVYRALRKKRRSYPFSAAISGSFMVTYGFLTGFGVSAQRAIVMFLVYLGAELLGETYDVGSALALSGILILAEEPLQLFQCGFQLSFLSVGAVALVLPVLQKRLNWQKKAAKSLLPGLSVTLVTLPCTLYWFYEWMPYAFFLNLIVIPLVPVVFLSGAAGMLAGSISWRMGMFLSGASAGVLKFFQLLLEKTALLPGSRFVVGQPKLWQIGVYYLLFLVAVFGSTRSGKHRKKEKQEKQKKCSRVFRIFLLLLAWGILYFPFRPSFEATFLDVGQGDGIFLRTEEGTTCLIDGGSTTISDVGTYRLLPFLKSRGVSVLDYLFLSHMDADHINGAEELLKNPSQGLSIRNLCLAALPEDETRERLEREAKRRGVNLLFISRGTVFREKEAWIRCLSPVRSRKKENENENSQVLLMELGKLRFLFTGDLGEEGEEELLKTGMDLRADVLKVGHHGSRYSTGEAFLQAVQPKYAIISCGENNRYGHPAWETVERLEKAGCRIFYTMKSGAITLSLPTGKKGWKLEQKFDRIERGDSHEHS